MRAVEVTDSVFNPELAPKCVDPPSPDPTMGGASGSLTSPDCQARLAGQRAPDRRRTLYGADAGFRCHAHLEVLTALP